MKKKNFLWNRGRFWSPLVFVLLWVGAVNPVYSKGKPEAVTEEPGIEKPGEPAVITEEGEIPFSGLDDVFEPEPVQAVDTEFSELWAYLIDKEEAALGTDLPLTDIGYFGAEVDSYGDLVTVPRRSKIDSFKGRVHMVVACNSRGLTHFVLDPKSPARSSLISQLVKAAAPFDGLQIDFELVPAKDGEFFLSFLKELRQKLPDKMFTVALPARLRVIQQDVYDYANIAPLVDRILVMAYDEHWSGSEPGPIASMDWCRKVAAHAQEQIPPEKLIMGVPFYGRIWGSENTFRAFFHSRMERVKKENGVKRINRIDSIPHFSYTVPITVTAYYEDALSITERLAMYSAMGIDHVGFWRLGQEDPSVWEHIHRK
ncbi:MAG: glycoside hydrolase [Spirochaetaceae bacterium]|jgi:hypothetical protein|nr:glycoside hydrolase [Spirochaetaceae bacterium]